jgi:peptide/nickel transport system permease protein
MAYRHVARRLAASPKAMVGVVLTLLLAVLAVGGVRLARHDPLAIDVDRGLSATGAPLPPSTDSPLGTDDLGRDEWARIAAAAPATLAIAVIATLLALAIGLAVGLAAGYAGGWIDHGLMRLVDLVLAFPYLLLAILLAALLHETALASASTPVVLTLAIVGWPMSARVIRGKAMAVVRSDYVAAARTLGASPVRIAVRHVLPNVAGVAIAVGVPLLADTLLAEATLNWVGLGPTPSWGRMMYEGREYYRSAPWLTLAPGLAIILAVVALHLLGDVLRDALDPRVRA